MFKSRRCRALAALSLALLSGAKTKAIEASDLLLFDIGPFSLRPQINLDLQYNDNVYFREVNVDDDFITVISPALKLQIGKQLPNENHASVQYTLNQLFYLDNTELDATQHRISTDLRYDSGRVVLTGRDNIDFLRTVIGGAFGLPGRPVDRFTVADVYHVLYRISDKTGAYIQGEHNLTDYEEDVALFDRRRVEGTLGFDWRYSERTAFFGEGFYGHSFLDPNLIPSNPPSARFIGGFVGVRGNFTDRFTGRAKVGYESTSFSDGTPASSGPAADITLGFSATERLHLDLSYGRRQEVSVQFTRSAYTSDRVALQASQVLGTTGRLRAGAGVSYNWITYEPSVAFRERDDTYFTADASLTYYFETWFIARLAYAFEAFDSSLPSASTVDYKVNRITLSFAVGF